jgi:hypothetical protein
MGAGCTWGDTYRVTVQHMADAGGIHDNVRGGALAARG